MNTIFAATPILMILLLMTLFRWSMVKAGLTSYITCVLVGLFVFGLNPQVYLISQLKAVILFGFILGVLVPALYIYNYIDQSGGIEALAGYIKDRPIQQDILVLLLAWAFSGFLEGMAGFGLPIAIIAPILLLLGQKPMKAVALVAIGHAWAVTLGDMGTIFQALIGVTKLSPEALVPVTAGLLGVACLVSGFICMAMLGLWKYWYIVLITGVTMSTVQLGLVLIGLIPIATIIAGMCGVIVGMLLSVEKFQSTWAFPRGMMPAIVGYGSLALLMLVLYWPNGVQPILSRFVWQATIPEVSTSVGFITPTGLGQAYRFFLHPGFSMLVIGMAISLIFPRIQYAHSHSWKRSLAKTWKMGLPVSLGILLVLGVSAMMDYCGMTQLIAEAFAKITGELFPIVSPLVGMLGAFTTGSNTSSNVLFAPMQVTIAGLLGISPTLIAAAQTTGGSLGSMIAPAKIAMGCATIQHQEKAGEVLRITLLPGICMALLIGVLTFLASRFF